MKREYFMNQLERLLQGISDTEREEALQYYNDYFDDAGAENEQEVIEALGNPARVAENIKRDLSGGSTVEAAAQKMKASDRVLMEYGKTERDARADSGGEWGWETGYSGYAPEKKKRLWERMPVWAVALLVTVLVFFAPAIFGVLLGVLGTAVGILVCWFALIFCGGAAAAALLIAMVALVAGGIVSFPAAPGVGFLLVGGGLVCGCAGLLCLMLTVVMAGAVTPVIWRGIACVFRVFGGRKAVREGGFAV